MLVPVISLAFLIVIASTAIYTPLLLYLFDLRKVGWLWEHGALFSAMISSTDAVAVAAILKKGGRRMHVRKLEGPCMIGIITTACNCLLLILVMHSMGSRPLLSAYINWRMMGHLWGACQRHNQLWPMTPLMYAATASGSFTACKAYLEGLSVSAPLIHRASVQLEPLKGCVS